MMQYGWDILEAYISCSAYCCWYQIVIFWSFASGWLVACHIAVFVYILAIQAVVFSWYDPPVEDCNALEMLFNEMQVIQR